jgi:hypothetical protein
MSSGDLRRPPRGDKPGCSFDRRARTVRVMVSIFSLTRTSGLAGGHYTLSLELSSIAGRKIVSSAGGWVRWSGQPRTVARVELKS